MKTKLKLLFLALLGLILIPNTYAYELSEIRNWSESWAPPTTTRHRGMCLHYNRDWYMTFDGKGYSYADISRDNTSCSEWAVLGNFFAPRDYNSPWYDQIYNDYFSYVNSKQNGEWIDMIRTVYQNWEHKTVITTLPSRTAYKRTSNAGIDYMFTQIYFYHNQFILYDPIKEVWLSFLGKMNVVWGAVFANPGTTEDNLRFIDYVRKKAYSATITNTAAWKRLLGTDVSMSRLQAMNWSKSYTMNKGGSSFLPPNFKIDKQGSEWFQYIEDIEFTAPDWNAGKPNNNWTWNQVAQNYRACVSRWSDIKVLAQISKSCWDDPLDSETLNWVKVDSWNWEWDAKTIIDQLEWGNKIKCWRFANIKKKFYDRYSKEWLSWYKDFNNYSFTPEALDVQAQCRGEELEQEHWSANISWNVNATSDTPFTNWVNWAIDSVPFLNLPRDYLFNPVANFVSDWVISMIWKEDTVVCKNKDTWKDIMAQEVLNDEKRLFDWFDLCPSWDISDCSWLVAIQDEIYFKYKACEDKSHFIRNHLWDIWNKKFRWLWFVQSFVAVVKTEYNKWKKVFPIYVCKKSSFSSSEYDKLLYVILVVFVLLVFKLFK